MIRVLRKNFSSLMQGNHSDGRVCVFLMSAQHVVHSLTNTVRQRLHDVSSAERWTSRDHDLSKTSGRRSVLVSLCPSQTNDEVIGRNTLSIRAEYRFKKQLSLGDAYVLIVLIPKFLVVALDTLWRARIDFVRARLGATSNKFCRSFEAFLSLHVFAGGVCAALDRRCEGRCGLPHAVLASESVRHVSFFPKQLGGSLRENHGQGPNSTFVTEKFGNDVRNWLAQLKMTSRLKNLMMNLSVNVLTKLSMRRRMNRLNSKKRSNLRRTCMLLRSC